MKFTLCTLTALVFTTSIAAAAPRNAAPTHKAGVHKTLKQLEKGALKGVFSDQKAFAAKLAKAMNGDVVVVAPR